MNAVRAFVNTPVFMCVVVVVELIMDDCVAYERVCYIKPFHLRK